MHLLSDVYCDSGCATVTSTCVGPLMDEPGGGCVWCLRCQTNMAVASIAMIAFAMWCRSDEDVRVMIWTRENRLVENG